MLCFSAVLFSTAADTLNLVNLQSGALNQINLTGWYYVYFIFSLIQKEKEKQTKNSSNPCVIDKA